MTPRSRIGAVTGKRLQRAGRYADRWRGELERLIVDAHAEGGSLRDIARLAGVSHEKVRQVVRQATISSGS